MRIDTGDYSDTDGGGRGFPAKCACGLSSVIYTSGTQDNPGRPFFRCPTQKKKHLFKWVEDGVYEEVVDALPRIAELESENQELQNVVREMKEEVCNFKLESQKLKKMVNMCFGFLCLITIIVIVIVIMINRGDAKVVELMKVV